MGRSRLGGVPTFLPPGADSRAGQLALPLDTLPLDTLPLDTLPIDADRGPGQATKRTEILPGVVHVSGWLELSVQRTLVEHFRRWAVPPAGLRHPRVPRGHLMTVQSVCLGWHWQPYVYSRTAEDTDGAPVKPMPDELVDLARGAVAEAYGSTSEAAVSYAPDAAIVNLYTPEAHLGLHQDGEEPSDAPVVTIALGDTCVFRLAGVDRRTAPFTDIEMRSGDLLVFGGPNRRIYHGVPKVLPGTVPGPIGLPEGRLSITIRQTGLEG
jgi:alkylated DNA repair protein (DNA oxidative demethylase)